MKVDKDRSTHKREKFTVSMFRNDCVVRSYEPGVRPEHLEDVTRSEIDQFSDKSRKKLAFYACNTDVVFKSMITVTVHPDVGVESGLEFKAALATMVQWIRDQKYSFLWFLEFQKNGSPHAHILLSGSSSEAETTDKNGNPFFREESLRLSKLWTGHVCASVGADIQMSMFSEQSEAIEKMCRASVRWEPVRDEDGAAKYACKYAYKCEQKSVPYGFRNVGRFWGNSRDVKPKRVHVSMGTWAELESAGFAFYEVTDDGQTYGGPMAVQFGHGWEGANRR